jgi:hypothetical protein
MKPRLESSLGPSHLEKTGRRTRMNRLMWSPTRVRFVLLATALAAVITVGVVGTGRATSSAYHASQYWLRLSCYNCGGCNQPGSAYFPSVGGQVITVNQEKCAAGPDNQKGGTIEVKIMSGGKVVLSGTVVMDDLGESNRHTLGTHDGLTYSTYCSKGYIGCGGGSAKDTWFVDVEATCN